MDALTKIKGITLIELLITLAVIGVIIAIALPQFNNLIKNNTLITSTNGFVALLNYARTEAVTREENIVLCATTNASAALPNCDSTNWEDGWLLFSDVGNTPNSFDNNDVLLKRASSATRGNTIRTTFVNLGLLRFAKNGFASSAGTISFCDDRGIDDSRAITVSRVGRVSSLGRGNAAASCP